MKRVELGEGRLSMRFVSSALPNEKMVGFQAYDIGVVREG